MDFPGASRIVECTTSAMITSCGSVDTTHRFSHSIRKPTNRA